MSSESDCPCRCHLGGAFIACDVDAGSSGVPGVAYCGPHTTGTEPSGYATAPEPAVGSVGAHTPESTPQNRSEGRELVCEDCGAVAGSETLGVHQWTDGCCVLPEHNYRRAHPPRATVGHVCRGCVERLRDWLTEIIELYAGLPDVVPVGSVPDDTARHKHTKQPASPAPVRLDAWAMLHDRDRLYRTGEPSDLPDVPAVLADLAYRVADDLGIEPGQNLAESLTGAATFLATRIEDAAGSAWIDELDADLKWVRRALRNAHGVTDVQALGKCLTVTDGRDCGGRVWPSRDGDPRPKCDRCQRRYGTHDLLRLRMMQQNKQTERGETA